MNGYVTNIEKASIENKNFRKVLFTAPHSQLVVMSLKPGEEIGKEVHADNDQFIRIEAGDGEVIIDGAKSGIHAEFAFVIPAGAEHNVVNTGSKEMKLYTIYSPAHHPEGTVHATKEDAEKAEAVHA